MLELALTAQVLVLIIMAGIFFASGPASIFYPLTGFLGVFAVGFVIRLMLVHYMGFDMVWKYMVFSPSEAQQLKTLVVSSVGLIVFTIASLTVGWTGTRFQEATPSPFTEQQKLALIIATAFLAPLVAYSIY